MKILPEIFALPFRTIAGAGASRRLPAECAGFGGRGVLVHGKSLRRSGALKLMIETAPAGLDVLIWEHTGGEPTLAQLTDLLRAARGHGAAWVAGVGGGSVLDLAKACAGLFHAGREVVAYHDGAPIDQRGISFIAAPTTAGTGSEATVNSVLTNPEKRVKKSIRDPALMAQLVILDPDLLADCPKPVIAAAGMDALTQALESFASRRATLFSDAIAFTGIQLIDSALEAVYAGADAEARLRLLTGSYCSGLGLSMAGLGVVHGLAHPLGLSYHLPHGLVCGVCLPYAIELNREAMGEKYERVSRALGQDLLARVRHLLQRLGLESPLRGQALTDRDALVKETLAAWSTAANPKTITAADVEWLLQRLTGPG